MPPPEIAANYVPPIAHGHAMHLGIYDYCTVRIAIFQPKCVEIV